MDLERIKQNLRIRSGREKKPRKPKPSLPPQSSVTSEPKTNGIKDEKKPTEAKREEPTANGKSNEEPAPVSTPGPPSVMSEKPSMTPGVTEKVVEERQKTQNVHSPPRSTSGSPRDQPDTYRVQNKKPLARKESDSKLSGGGYESPGSDATDFDLRPPAPKKIDSDTIEAMADELFSAAHLKSMLHYPPQLARFTAFLYKYRPDDHPLLLEYLETEKAIKAVEYANALAAGMLSTTAGRRVSSSSRVAASLDTEFEKLADKALKRLVSEALPTYITYNLVKIGSECLANEIAGQQTPMMTSLIGGLSEVFCISDPNQKDNPIVYASEEFYRYTGYGRDEVIGRNCRFLQGSRTKRESPMRLRDAIEKGEGTSETLLNYRKDGRPFINVLMIAPLHDNKGNIKYHIGAQIDASGLVEGGRALDGFHRYLATKEEEESRNRDTKDRGSQSSHLKKQTLSKLRDLSEMFDLEESAVLQGGSRPESRDTDDGFGGSMSTDKRSLGLVYNDSDTSDDEDGDTSDWQLGESGPRGLSGRLPGIYETFILVRPAPSLRIIFASPKMRRIGRIVQSPLLSHIAAPASTLTGLYDNFRSGTAVAAKVFFMSRRGQARNGTQIDADVAHENGEHGRACWISATPLLGSDDKIGVWMVVVVAKSMSKRKPPKPQSLLVQKVDARTNPVENADSPSADKTPEQQSSPQAQEEPTNQEQHQDDVPVKPERLNGLQNGVKDASADRVNNSPYKAETPVDEYEDLDDEYNHVPKSYSVKAPSISDLETKQRHEHQEYVRLHTRSPSSARADRVHIRADSDGEQDGDSADALRAASQRSKSPRLASPARIKSRSPPTLPRLITSPPPDIPPSPPPDAFLPDEASDIFESISEPTEMIASVTDPYTIDSSPPRTPVRSRPRTPTMSEPTYSQDHKLPHVHQKRPRLSNSQYQSGSMLDYIRNPSSKNSGELRRGLNGRWHSMDDDDDADDDCTSPYSVD